MNDDLDGSCFLIDTNYCFRSRVRMTNIVRFDERRNICKNEVNVYHRRSFSNRLEHREKTFILSELIRCIRRIVTYTPRRVRFGVI